MQSILRLIRNILLNIVYIISTCIPKNKKIILFSSWFGLKYADNPKYIYEYFIRKQLDYEVSWMVKNKEVAKVLNDRHIKVVYAWSLAGIWKQLRAGAVVFTHEVSTEYLSPLIGYHTKRVQTWHGVPIKKIGFDDRLDPFKNFKTNIVNLLAPHIKNRIDMMIACSEEDQEKYISAFRLDNKKIKITGYPRNDQLMIKRNNRLREVKKIIYMPTLRGAPGSVFEVLSGYGFDFNQWNSYLKKNQCELHVKAHPAQKFSLIDESAIDSCDSIKIITNEEDVYEILGDFDMLITDYSGAYIDFLMTGKPIIIAAVDIEKYRSDDRGLYYSFEQIYFDSPCLSWVAVLNRLEQILQDKEDVDSIKKFQIIQRKFHKYLDANSSQRAGSAIIDLLSFNE
jgi:CDP-glycerol glycerophosphotransferase (TagB/SpsB family)